MEQQRQLLEIMGRFAGRRVAVLGDFVADVFVSGRPCRLSREAPVPILRYEGETIVPGSAGNVARNLTALGAKAVCIGAVGNDDMGRRLCRGLGDEGADVSALLMDSRVTTCTKTRIMAGDRHRAKQQVVRIDREPDGPLPDALADALLRETESRLGEVDALIISDYDGGVVSPTIIERAASWAEKLIVVADSRYRLAQFRDITAATPNESEFEACIGQPCGNGVAIGDSGHALRERLGMDALLITRGNQGMTLCTPDGGTLAIPIVGRDDVIDVTGAGDTVVAVFALSLACRASFQQAAHLANHAAGVVVMKAGTASCDTEELRRSIPSRSN